MYPCDLVDTALGVGTELELDFSSTEVFRSHERLHYVRHRKTPIQLPMRKKL